MDEIRKRQVILSIRLQGTKEYMLRRKVYTFVQIIRVNTANDNKENVRQDSDEMKIERETIATRYNVIKKF